jgi:hypothetical protein
MDRVSGVVAALGAYDYIGLLGEHVNDFAFAFVAPLGADQYRIRHSLKGSSACRAAAPAIKSPEVNSG